MTYNWLESYVCDLIVLYNCQNYAKQKKLFWCELISTIYISYSIDNDNTRGHCSHLLHYVTFSNKLLVMLFLSFYWDRYGFLLDKAQINWNCQLSSSMKPPLEPRAGANSIALCQMRVWLCRLRPGNDREYSLEVCQ